MSFEEDTKKILDFFDNKELQEIFEDNFIHKAKVREAIKKVGVRIGINTTGIETDNGYDESTAECWQCALLKELGLEESSSSERPEQRGMIVIKEKQQSL